MKKISQFLNWRAFLLGILAIVAFVLILCESDEIFPLLASKVIGFSLAWLCLHLGKRWEFMTPADKAF